MLFSFGLSDLHGDGRVHEPSGPDLPSGFGFELTFRLIKKNTDATSPPTWPAALLQALAKYVFHTGNSFFAGDHISWHCPLDGSDFESRLQHMLIAEDLLLPPINGILGIRLNFGCNKISCIYRYFCRLCKVSTSCCCYGRGAASISALERNSCFGITATDPCVIIIRYQIIT